MARLGLPLMVRLGFSTAAAIAVIVYVVYSRPDPTRVDSAPLQMQRGSEVESPAPRSDRSPPAAAPRVPTASRRFASREAREQLIERVRAARVETAPPTKTYDFAGVDVPRASAAPPADRVHTGTLDKDYIRERIGEIVPLVAECYELAREVAPDLEGALAVDFVIDAEEEIGGYVADAAVTEDSELRHPALDECVTETVMSLEFPPPEGGGTMRVRYPFQFASE